jgi:hypothetical protein
VSLKKQAITIPRGLIAAKMPGFGDKFVFEVCGLDFRLHRGVA